MVEAMKRDLLDVISKYVQVDRDKIDVHFENQNDALAMLANIPITGVNRNEGGGSGGSSDDDNAEPGDDKPAGSSKRKKRKTSSQNGSPAPA